MASGLAWFSLGLGLYEVVAAERLDAALGMEGKAGLLRFCGLREIMAGVGIFLSQPRPTAWVWARVAGDALDLATLNSALKVTNPKQDNVAIALAAVAGVTALDIWCALHLSREG